jgi:putative CocE/NonD family hydrolase
MAPECSRWRDEFAGSTGTPASVDFAAVRVVTEFPRPVRSIENARVAMADGIRLTARIWLPGDAEADPVPAVLEAIPYRKDDWTAQRDALQHPYVAGHGYAVVRLDLRGSGSSEGVLLDEYLTQEQDDIVAVIAWIASQPWCTGAVGMTGISWGGFNALQVAARRPPGLKAIMTLCSTDDRYADDVHYIGGCVLAVDALPWASQMLVWNATPPDPVYAGESWRDLWLERLERTPPFVEAWLSHQRRDGYWQHGSVCEDFGAIECPVYAVGGWADGYTNAIFRLLEGLPGVRKGLVGPWAHAFPHDGVPGPAIGFLQECLRWWDRWLKGIENGVDEEPMLRAWLQDPVPGAARHDERPGRWVAEETWPGAGVSARTLSLGDGTLRSEPGPGLWLHVRGSQLCGLDSGLWCPYGDASDLPPDQRLDDGLSLTFDSAPLDERLEILGFPEATLAVAADRPVAFVAVRLCDVAPTGESTLVSTGVLNLTHRESHGVPAPLVPGERYDVTVRLNAAGHVFLPRHRIRLAVSPTYWPWVWPSPEPVVLSVLAGESGLTLPARAPRALDGELRAFDEPECSAPLEVEILAEGHSSRTIERDVLTGEAVLSFVYGGGRQRLPGGLELGDDYHETFRIVEGDPLSARVETDHEIDLCRDGWHVHVVARSAMWSDTAAFHTANTVEAYENGEQVFARTSDFSVPRDLV